jgi:hypothetical protein
MRIYLPCSYTAWSLDLAGMQSLACFELARWIASSCAAAVLVDFGMLVAA